MRIRLSAMNLILAIPLLMVIAVNLPLFSPTLLLTHDTSQQYYNFYWLYVNALYNHQTALWLPFGTWGVPTWSSLSLTPVSQCFLTFGSLFHVHDTMLVYKLSCVADQLVFVVGLYLCGTVCYQRRFSVLFVGIAGAMSTIWYAQIYFNFHIYYLLPLALYLLLRFFRTNRPEFLWYTGTVVMVWLLGNSCYFVSLYFFLFIFVFIFLVIAYRRNLPAIRWRSWHHLGAFMLFLGICSLFMQAFLHWIDGLVTLSPGRDPGTGKVTLETFLTYGGTCDTKYLAASVLTGLPPFLPWGSLDNSIYFGLLPLLLIPLGVFHSNKRDFFAILGGAILLVGLSFGGGFAKLVYHFPMMDYYRHIGLVFSVVKILLLLCAGFGMDVLLEHRYRQRFVVNLVLIYMVLGGLFLLLKHNLVAGGIHEALRYYYQPISALEFTLRIVGMILMSILSIAALALFVLAGRFRPQDAAWKLRTAAILLVSALIVDLASFQVLASYRCPRVPPELRSAVRVFDASPPTMPPYRTAVPQETRAQQALALITAPGALAVYNTAYNFIGFDPIESAYRTDLLPADVHRLRTSIPMSSPQYAAVIGSSLPKVRLVTSAQVVRTPEEAVQALKACTRPDTTVIIEADDAEPTEQASTSPGSVRVMNFSANEVRLQAQVDGPAGAWLVYADAYHPGWQARCDGHTTMVYRANVAFKAVKLPPGKHEVIFTFAPGTMATRMQVIMWLSLLSGISMILWIGWLLFTQSSQTGLPQNLGEEKVSGEEKV